VEYAISVKQPWAALLAHGHKTIEVRRWSTRRRGRVLIHAAREPDKRPEAWAKVPRHLAAAARQNGGIVGAADLIECRPYKDRPAFIADRALHLNDPGWFRPPALYGFVFARQRPLPFVRQGGALYFFEVPVHPQADAAFAQLLVSVRSAGEALAARHGGADLIDVKAPRRGSLGRPSDRVIAAVVRALAGCVPVSAALGELIEMGDAACRHVGAIPMGLSFIKCGLAGLGRRSSWSRRLEQLRESVAGQGMSPEVVTVAYADWRRAKAPTWQSVADYAIERREGVLLLDTFDKSWRAAGECLRPATLLDWLSEREVYRLAERCRRANVRLALAGSLRLAHIHRLWPAQPTWFAVRGAVCAANQRDGAVHPVKVRALAELLRWRAQQATGES
jgi:(5-formylfuran-3-yl)methyl phosphate synthase